MLKAKGLPLAKIASRVMTGEKLSKFNLKDKSKGMYAVKEAVFPVSYTHLRAHET